MRVRISYIVEIDDTIRREINAWYGRPGLASREEVKRWYEHNGRSMDDDLMAGVGTAFHEEDELRAIRTSMYPPPGTGEPIHTFTTERDLKVPITQMQEEMEAPGGFVVTEIFEVSDDLDISGVSIEGMRRFTADEDRQEREKNMAIMYYWSASRWRITREGGVCAQTRPSPLSVDELTIVLRQLALHPDYKHFLIVAIAKDFTIVQMRDGEIKRQEGQ